MNFFVRAAQKVFFQTLEAYTHARRYDIVLLNRTWLNKTSKNSVVNKAFNTSGNLQELSASELLCHLKYTLLEGYKTLLKNKVTQLLGLYHCKPINH